MDSTEESAGSTGVALAAGDSLKKEINRREAFERKNAELEGVNDELRLENGELRMQMQMLRKKLEEMAAKPKSGHGSSSATNTSEGQRKHQKSKQSSQKKQSSTPVHTADEAHEEEEVHTLRKEKKALKDELEQTKAKQMNFEAAFQTEFDLRTTMEEKYDSLRERYERLVLENDELRRVLRQHNILIPPPPSLRAKLRITTDGPMKPPRRQKRSASLQSDTRPKSESAAAMAANFYSHEYLTQDAQSVSTSYLANSLSPRQTSASPLEHGQFLFTELKTIQGSCEIPAEEKGTKEYSQATQSAEKLDQSNGQPLEPVRTPTGEVRKVQSHSIEDLTQPEKVPHSDLHNQSYSESGGARNYYALSKNSGKNGASEFTGQPETFKSQETVGVTITVSAETDTGMTQESNEKKRLKSNQLAEHEINLQTGVTVATANGLKQESGQLKEELNNEEDKPHHIEQPDTNNVVPKEEAQEKNSSTKNPENMEWELDSLMANSAQQLESAKAFYAEMHAHLKKKQNTDNDSDD